MLSFILIVIAISLFVDAFSLSLVPGSSKLKNKEILLLSLIIGIFNLIVVWTGFFFGEVILSILPISPKLLVAAILLYTGLKMLLDARRAKNIKTHTHLLKLTIVSLVFSLDNISLGLSINYLDYNYYHFSLLIAFLSIIFSIIGLNISKFITNTFYNSSKIIAGAILIMISFVYILL